MPLRPAGENYVDLAWAPTADVEPDRHARRPRRPQLRPLLGQHQSDETDVTCKKEPSFGVIRALHWSPDGKTILGLGVKLPDRTGKFGIVRWTLKNGKPAFSPDLADWNKGKFLTDIDTPDKGVLDAAVSPDGKRLALVSNKGSSAFRLWLAENREDFLMTSAKPTPVRACKVSWRCDSKES